MKQETVKKSKKWLWIVLALVAVLAAVAVALAIFLQPAAPNNEGPGEETPTSEIYWNIDRAAFTQNADGLSDREKAEDGLFHLRFATQGKLVELATTDKMLVNYIDTLDAMGLVLDADGLIIDVLDVRTIAVETAKSFYVKAVAGNMVTVNSSIAMNGMDMVLNLTDSTCVMDVRAYSDTVGQSVELNVMDVVSVYGSEDVPVEEIFLMSRPASSPLYLRLGTEWWDSAKLKTTRVPDENGVYTIEFAIGGKIEQLKCKDPEVVKDIDSAAGESQVMGLTFDAEGYITSTITAATAIRGKMAGIGYNITAINGTSIEATRLYSGAADEGKVISTTITEDTQIIMSEDDCGYFIGERVANVKMDDYVTIWTDMDGNALYIKVDRRIIDGINMYFNLEMKYNWTDKVTSRKPDDNGYYVFELVSNGKKITAKTKSKDMATKLDSVDHQFFGLKVQGGIIKEFYDKACITGGHGLSTRYVTEVMPTLIQLSGTSNFDQLSAYILTPETQIYDMTGDYGTKLGQKTTLKVGDRVIAERNVQNHLLYVFVINRYHSGTKLYWNIDPKYSWANKETTRTIDAEGYYNYVLYCEGKEVLAKTKDKAIATVIDAQDAPVAALKISNGIIKAAYPAIEGLQFGVKRFNHNNVNTVSSDKVVSCYYFSNGERKEASSTFKMAKNCQIYNVSTNFDDHRGEKSSLKSGDQIQAFQNMQTGELTHIWIEKRPIDAPLYFHTNRQYDSTNGVTTRVPNEEGYYTIDLFVDGQIKTFKTKDKALMSAVDKYGSENFFTMKTKGDLILLVDAPSASTNAITNLGSFQDIMKISGKTITTRRNRPGSDNLGETTKFTYNSKTKIYDVSYLSENQFKAVKLEKGDRISAYADSNGNIKYIFVMYPHTRVEGYESKCSHCNKTVWWEPWLGGQITAAEYAHFYLPTSSSRWESNVGQDETAVPTALHNTVILDLNGQKYDTQGRAFKVYSDLILIDSVGGASVVSTGTTKGPGGNFEILGGTVTIYDGIKLQSKQGGNIHVSNKVITDADGKALRTNVGKLTIYDAVVEGWPNTDIGSQIVMTKGTELNIMGGTIAGGDVQVEAGVKVKLGGNPKIGGKGLVMASGAKIAESKLSSGASVLVVANGTFTEKLSNAAAQKAFYTTDRRYYPVEVKEGALWTDRDPNMPEFVAEPMIPSKPELLSVDNSNLALDANSQAKCPVCNEVVTWTPITNTGASYSMTPEGHYYLAEDITYEKYGFAVQLEAVTALRDKITCMHLNGHSITAAKNCAAIFSGMPLNIMGNGIVTGNMTEAGRGTALEVNSAYGNVNVYGGTYKKLDPNNANGLVSVNKAGGQINIFENALIDGTNTNGHIVRAKNGSINIYGGEIRGGLSGACVYPLADVQGETNVYGTISIFGGLLNGVAKDSGAGADIGTTLNIYGGEIRGGMKVNEGSNIVIAGTPVIESMRIYPWGMLTIGKMSDGASVGVAASGKFTYPTENIEAYAKYFKSLTADPVKLHYYSLAIGEIVDVKPDESDINANLQFVAGTKEAKCALCGQYVEWTPITNAEYGTNGIGQVNDDGKHYYLAEDITYTGSGDWFISGPGSQKTLCIHLNGHNFTGTNHGFLFGYGSRTRVLGNGIVSGGRNESGVGTIHYNSGTKTGIYINLYGGTYTVSEGNTKGSAISIYNNGSEINLYEGVKAIGSDTAPAVYIATSNTRSSVMNIKGATIEGGFRINEPSKANEYSFTTVVVEDSTIDFVDLGKDVSFTVSGNTVIGKLNLVEEAKFTVGELGETAKIDVLGNGVITELNSKLAEYVEKGYILSTHGCKLSVVEDALVAEAE